MRWPTVPHVLPDVSVHEVLRKLSSSGSGWNSLHFRVKLKQNIISSECGEHCPGLGCFAGETQIC